VCALSSQGCAASSFSGALELAAADPPFLGQFLNVRSMVCGFCSASIGAARTLRLMDVMLCARRWHKRPRPLLSQTDQSQGRRPRIVARQGPQLAWGHLVGVPQIAVISHVQHHCGEDIAPYGDTVVIDFEAFKSSLICFRVLGPEVANWPLSWRSVRRPSADRHIVCPRFAVFLEGATHSGIKTNWLRYYRFV
jgi:hypothetical protein